MEVLTNTLYINLSEREDRKTHVLQEFTKLGISGERFNAIKTKNGCVGCTISHIKCLELAKSNDWEQVFICEDDIEFTNPQLFLENLNKFYNEGISWDVIVVGGNNCPPFQKISDFCIRAYNIQTTTGYIVNKHYYDTLINNFKEGLKNLLKEPENKKKYAIDMYWKLLQQSDKWYFIIPPTVIQINDYSDIEERIVNYSGIMLDLDKKALIEYYQRLEQQKQLSTVGMSQIMHH